MIEAKDNNHCVSHGMQQALGYAELLLVPCAFSSNGDGFASHNKTAAAGEDIETEFGLDAFNSPDELWRRYKISRGIADAEEALVTEPSIHDFVFLNGLRHVPTTEAAIGQITWSLRKYLAR